jgi:hypothetical protein
MQSKGFGLMKEAQYYYQVLGLKPGATEREVIQAYMDSAKVWNSGRFADDPALQEKAQGKMREIHEASDYLLAHIARSQNQGTRKGTERAGRPKDRSFGSSQSPLDAPPPTPSPPKPRTSFMDLKSLVPEGDIPLLLMMLGFLVIVLIIALR